MKKSIFALTVVLFTVIVFYVTASAMDDVYYGGPSRLQALGGQEIVVQDSASMLDLYEEGFAASLFTRPQKSVIFLYPEIDAYFSKHIQNNANKTTYDVIDYSGGNALYKGINNGLLFRLTPDTILNVKPYFNIGSGSTKITNGSPDDNKNRMEYDGSGDIELVQNMTGRITVGGDLGYYRDTTFSDDKPSGSPDSKDTSYFDKIDYELSAALLPESEGGWTFALSAGDRAGVMPVYFSESSSYYYNYSYMLDRGTIGSLFSLHDYVKTDDLTAMTRTESYIDKSMTGYIFGLGAACGSNPDALFSAKVRVLADVNDRASSHTVITNLTTGAATMPDNQSYLDVKTGAGIDSDFNYRKNMGGYTLGAKLSLFDIDYKSEDPLGSAPDTANDLLYYKFSTGADIGDKAFSMPLELFFEHSIEDSKQDDIKTENVNQFFDFGAKLGTEFTVSGWPVLRAGLDYVVGGLQTETKTNGTITTHNAPPGASGNPWNAQLGINCGAGFSSDSMETNIAVRYVPYWFMPANNVYTQYSSSALTIMADIKFSI